MERFRWFKTKFNKWDKIKPWKLDKKEEFKPHRFHVIRVDMKTRELWVYSHFYMTMVTFVGKTPIMMMSQRVFNNMFGENQHWKSSWVEVPWYEEILKKK